MKSVSTGLLLLLVLISLFWYSSTYAVNTIFGVGEQCFPCYLNIVPGQTKYSQFSTYFADKPDLRFNKGANKDLRGSQIKGSFSWIDLAAGMSRSSVGWDEENGTIDGAYLYLYDYPEFPFLSSIFQHPIQVEKIIDLLGKPDEVEASIGNISGEEQNFWIVLGYSYGNYYVRILAVNTIELSNLSTCSLDAAIDESTAINIAYLTERRGFDPDSSLRIPSNKVSDSEVCEYEWGKTIELIFDGE